jgi:predicted unusual protein kinase regulating ubiquinone biosynthesis (AarF/ABC1/UbiB family)
MTDQDKAGKSSMARIKTRPLERNLSLARLGLGAGGQIMAHSIANLFRGESARSEADRDFYQRQAQVLADELGQLKGSVMKAGQMLSLYGQYFLPPEAVAVLSGLQDDTAPVDWAVVEPVLRRALGARRMAELEIEERPMAAASLGQAHRARRRRDGRELVVKIQYPGVADAIESDIRTLSRLLTMSRLAPRGLDLTPVFNEVREMLHREVDYESEAHFTRSFAAKLRDDPRFAVPEVIDDYSTDQVLTTSYEAGVSARDPQVRTWSQTRRNRLAAGFLELFLTEFFAWGMVQTDPHFGNYRLRPGADGTDRIVLLDFGATRTFGRGFVEQYGRIVQAALLRDRPGIYAASQAIGLMRPGFPEPVLEAFARLCELIVEPFNALKDPATPAALRNARGAYRWGESDLPLRVGRAAALNSLSVHFRVPPREIVFLHRRMAGVFIMLATLGAELDARQTLLDALAGADPG